MGFRKELYTKEYFTGVNDHGQPVGYGVDGFKEWQQGQIRPVMAAHLGSIPLQGKDVLELGYGRGESIRYFLTKGKVHSYVGVDFSEAAYELATKMNAEYLHKSVEVYLGDALEFMSQQKFSGQFDAVFMLDVIEHIPTTEVQQLLPLIHTALRPGGYCMAETPFYSVDEDYIAQGYTYIKPSPTDIIPQTVGMHCNKFTKKRLFAEMQIHGMNVLGNCCFQKPSRELLAYLPRVA